LVQNHFICEILHLGHGMEPLIFWTANWRKGLDRRVEGVFPPSVSTALNLMGDWCGEVSADT
jgi:hypothetical protein